MRAIKGQLLMSDVTCVTTDRLKTMEEEEEGRGLSTFSTKIDFDSSYEIVFQRSAKISSLTKRELVPFV